MPYSGSAENAAQYKRRRKNNEYITTQGDHQRSGSFSKSLQRAGGSDGYGGYQESRADNAQCGFAGPDSFRIGSKHFHKPFRNRETDSSSGDHDHAAHGKCDKIDPAHPSVFLRAVIVADHRAHSLNDPAGGKVKESLQFIIDSQDYHIALGKSRQKTVQYGYQKRRQGQVQSCRNPDGIQTKIYSPVRFQVIFFYTYMNGAEPVDRQVDHKVYHLSDPCGKGRALDSHFGKRSQSEDHYRIQKDIGKAAAHQGDHGDFHLSDRLKDLFKGQVKSNDDGKSKNNIGITQSQIQDISVLREKTKKMRHKSDTYHRHENTVDTGQDRAPGSCGVRRFIISGAKVKGDQSVDPYAETDGNGVDEILDRVDQRKRGHGVFTDFCHKVAVYNIIEGIYQHGDHHGKRHGHDQGKNRFFFHKGFVHFYLSLRFQP